MEDVANQTAAFLLRNAAVFPRLWHRRDAVSLLRVLGLVAGRARTITPVAFVGEAAVARAPVRIGRLVASRTRTLPAVAVVRHARINVGLGGGRHGHVQSGDRDACEQSQSNGSSGKGLQHVVTPPRGILNVRI